MEALIPFMPWIWAAIIVLTIVWELSTFELECLWFTISATIALVLSFFPDIFSPVIQLLIFAILSLILFFSLKKWAQKMMKVPNVPTNVDALIGKEITIIDSIKKGKNGTAKVNGIVWNVCFENKELEADTGETVIISRVEGNKIVVTKEQ